jgi:hypothetical protein
VAALALLVGRAAPTRPEPLQRAARPVAVLAELGCSAVAAVVVVLRTPATPVEMAVPRPRAEQAVVVAAEQ